VARVRPTGWGASLGGFLLVVVSACGGGGEGGFFPDPMDSPATSAAADSRSGGGTTGWPDGIPAEIPVLDAPIGSVLGAGGALRIFIEDTSDDRFVAYVAALEEAGFEMEFLVYESEVDPGRAAEKAARGEYDAVRARKGPYSLFLEWGAGTGSLFIEGLDPAVVEAYAGWPAEPAGTGASDTAAAAPVETREFPDYLPEVPGGRIDIAWDLPGGGFTAAVFIDEGYTLEDYLDVLVAAGYRETEESIEGAFVYDNGEHEVMVIGTRDQAPEFPISIQADP